MKNIKGEKGITLVALVVTVIVLLIILGIGIGASTGNKGNINQSKEVVATSDLSKVQQAVLENYIKYKQTGNERVLKGIAIEYTKALEELKKIDESLNLRKEESTKAEERYYKLQRMHLTEMGLENINSDYEYIVNYSTGEVFNITLQKTVLGNPLYIYAN